MRVNREVIRQVLQDHRFHMEWIEMPIDYPYNPQGWVWWCSCNRTDPLLYSDGRFVRQDAAIRHGNIHIAKMIAQALEENGNES